MQNLKQKIYRMLRWSQKYTQTDMVYLAKGGFWLTLGEIVSTIAAFLLAIVFANLLDPVTYGNYKYILSLVGILTIFSLSGIKTAVLQATARGLEGTFYTGFKIKLKWGVLGSLIAIVLAGYYFFQGNYTLPIPLLISAIFLPLMRASTIYDRFLVGKKSFDFQAKYSSLSTIISTGALITVLFLTKNLFWLIAVYFVSHTFLNYSFYLITQRKFRPNKKEDSQSLSYGKHLSAMNAIGIFAEKLDKILLFHFLGAAQLAIYSFVFIPVQPIKTILGKLGLLSLLKLSQKNIPELKKTFPAKILKLFLIMFPIVGLYILLAPYIYYLFFPKYTSAMVYSQVFAISLLLVPKIFLGQIFTAHMKQKELYVLSLTSSLSKIILLVILLPLYGIWGAISALMATELIHFIVLTILFKKIQPIPSNF